MHDNVMYGTFDTNVLSKTDNKTIYLFTKRCFDIMVSLFGILFLIPIALVVKIVTLLSGDTKSIFYSQTRIGVDGENFKIYKFRSMVSNADEVLENILKENGELAKEYLENKKMKKDPRITKIGKILRKTSIDELPQLINVLKGDMSLIGNRPYLVREKEDMGMYYESIIKTKPGITGLWQVSGKEFASFDNRLMLEAQYSNKCSIKLDTKIFFKTFKAIVKGHGAGI